MGMRQLETAILTEAKIITGSKKLRQKDIMEWSTGEIKIEPGEKSYFLLNLHIYIAVKQ